MENNRELMDMISNNQGKLATSDTSAIDNTILKECQNNAQGAVEGFQPGISARRRVLGGGIPPQVVPQWLGHANIATTERYAHLAPDTGEDLIDLLDAPKSGIREGVGGDVPNFTNTTTVTNGSQDAKNAV